MTTSKRGFEKKRLSESSCPEKSCEGPATHAPLNKLASKWTTGEKFAGGSVCKATARGMSDERWRLGGAMFRNVAPSGPLRLYDVVWGVETWRHAVRQD